MVLLDRREDIITTAVTTIVVMVVALERPVDAWEQAAAPSRRHGSRYLYRNWHGGKSGLLHLRSTKRKAKSVSVTSSIERPD